MGKKHFTEEQIAFALRQAESGTSVAEVIRKLGISEQTFYRWKKRFAGLGIAELRRLRTLKEKSRPLIGIAAPTGSPSSPTRRIGGGRHGRDEKSPRIDHFATSSNVRIASRSGPSASGPTNERVGSTS
jgi:putative transposase